MNWRTREKELNDELAKWKEERMELKVRRRGRMQRGNFHSRKNQTTFAFSTLWRGKADFGSHTTATAFIIIIMLFTHFTTQILRPPTTTHEQNDVRLDNNDDVMCVCLLSTFLLLLYFVLFSFFRKNTINKRKTDC